MNGRHSMLLGREVVMGVLADLKLQGHMHKNATTTPAPRRAIQQASGIDAELAAQFGVGRLTIRKWLKRGTTEDGSHTPHRLQTTLNARHEEIVVYLRT